MGLNDLVPEDKKPKRRNRTKKSKTDRHGNKKSLSHPEEGFNIGDRELELSDTIEPVDCNFCIEGVAFVVNGLARFGGRYRCYRIFCENSVMKHKRQAPENELASIRNKMEAKARGGGLDAWK